jgi:hypothetical protein
MICRYFAASVMANSASRRVTKCERLSKSGPSSGFQDSSTVVTKKDVNLADSVRFNGQCPVSRSGNAPGRGAFDAQSAQAISAAYYFDLAARDYFLADSAIELVIEGSSMPGFYRAVAKQRAYLLRPVGPDARNKTRFEPWQISLRLARILASARRAREAATV